MRTSQKPSWFNLFMQKKPEGFISNFQKIRSSQKPSWFNIHCGEKTKKVLFQTFQKIRSAQNPSWFDNPPQKKFLHNYLLYYITEIFHSKCDHLFLNSCSQGCFYSHLYHAYPPSKLPTPKKYYNRNLTSFHNIL
jgi:hypothetical protein